MSLYNVCVGVTWAMRASSKSGLSNYITTGEVPLLVELFGTIANDCKHIFSFMIPNTLCLVTSDAPTDCCQVLVLTIHMQCRESQKEKELLEKKLERTEKARAQEVQAVHAQSTHIA